MNFYGILYLESHKNADPICIIMWAFLKDHDLLKGSFFTRFFYARRTSSSSSSMSNESTCSCRCICTRQWRCTVRCARGERPRGAHRVEDPADRSTKREFLAGGPPPPFSSATFATAFPEFAATSDLSSRKSLRWCNLNLFFAVNSFLIMLFVQLFIFYRKNT